jgi:hypothetical protein
MIHFPGGSIEHESALGVMPARRVASERTWQRPGARVVVRGGGLPNYNKAAAAVGAVVAASPARN